MVWPLCLKAERHSPELSLSPPAPPTKPSSSELFHSVLSIGCLCGFYEGNIFRWGLKDYGSTLKRTNTQNEYNKCWFYLHRIIKERSIPILALSLPLFFSSGNWVVQREVDPNFSSSFQSGQTWTNNFWACHLICETGDDNVPLQSCDAAMK